MAEDRKKFYCREWAFQKLLHCLDQRPVSKTCGALLLGSSGCGKTTFCSELCWPSQGPSGRQQRTLNRRLLCYHFLQGHNEKSLSLSEFVRSLVTQILNHSTESHKERSMRRKIAQAKEQGETVSPKNTSYDKNLSENCNLPQESLYSNVYSENLLSPTLEAKKVPDPAPIPNMPINPRTVIADAYLEKLKSDPEIQIALRAKNIESNPDDCLKRALLFPLLEIDPPKTSLFIIIDSIDEHSFIYSNSTLTRSKPRERSSQSRTIAELLANHHHLFPQWLLLVCTAKKQSKSIAKMFTGFRKLSLDDLRKAQVVRDVQQYILARLDQENSLRQHISRDTAEMLNQLHIKSNGCFLYLEKVLDGVAESFIVLREVREIPGTLNGLYLWLCQRLFNRRQFAKVQPLLNVILAAKCALNESLLFDIVKVNNSKITIEDFRKRFHLLKKVVVISKNGTIRLFHHSFAEWLLDIKHCTQKYLCNIFHGHCILAMYYTLHAKVLNNQEIYDYAFHLTRMEQFLNEKPSQKCPTFMYKLSQEKAGNSLDKTSTEIYSDLKALQELTKSYENELAYELNNIENLESSFADTETSQNNLDDVNFETKLEEHFDSVHLKSPESEKNPIYAEVNKLKKTSNQITKSVEVSNQLMTTSCENNLLVTDYTNTASSLNNTATSCTMLEGALSKTQQHPILDLHTLTVLWLINSGCNVEECLLEGNEMAGVNFGAFLPTDQKVLRLLLEAGAVEQHDVAGCDYESQMSLASTSSEQSPEPLFDLQDLHGQAALHVAARLGQAQVVKNTALKQTKDGPLDKKQFKSGLINLLCKVLLESGANADQADIDGWTPLRAAAWGGHTEVVQLLVQHGCQLDSVDAENRTALRAAAWSGHEEIVKILLQHGANVNLTDHEGRTALIAAAYMGHSEIVDHLLDFGADINHPDADGRTALSVAALCAPRTPGVSVVSTLLERNATVDHKDKEGMTPLLVASFEGHRDVCELLLENEADVDHCDNSGRSPLWAAASMGHAPVVALLLFWGCAIDSMDSEGRTVLSVAAAQEVVRQLLDRGLDEQHRDNSGWTPLHYAAFEGHQDVCEALLEAGAKIDETDNEGKAPLTLAAQGGHTSLVNLFMDKYNAPVDQRPHDGKTALRLAALEGHYDIVQILVSNGADIDSKDADGRSTLYVLALDNRLAMSKYFIQQEADVETRDLEGRTPLHVSAWQGHTEMVSLLLTYGKALVDACDLENRTALHSASWQGHSDIVKILLEHGALPDHTCNQGATALGIAAQEGHELCVVALLEHGADPNHSDACGRNALRVAAKSGHRGVVRLLEEYNARSHKINMSAHTSSSANSIASSAFLASTAETKPLSASLYPVGGDWTDQQRRSMVSLGNHSSNSKSSSNLTGSSHSSRHGDRQRDTQQNTQPMSFTQQLQQCSRGGKTRPLSKLLSPLQSEPQSPIYASPPLSPVHDSSNNVFGAMNIYQPVLRHNNFAKAPDMHFARDTHMRIILGNSGSSAFGKDKKGDEKQDKDSNNTKQSNQKSKRNGIATNPALRLVANVKNGFDSAAANLRKSTSGANPASKTNSFHWRKETPL
ncbi:ankyrin repeat domain-containing protein 50 isoform X2 [Dendroctonus ponderosae]|uniref:ankyrin repeat domain-containing protein 50 isoform X2 n=1 Tax=Dendroctonus ponderosae TaxID=77166 RepID=UPI002035D6E2|nr:ankyrin repeat domain-containing protein 50 isoform X2 [Dendroctonus ponderosae]